jgi:CRP/FNR family transcriptional regulator, cyclic AMP receptor protein
MATPYGLPLIESCSTCKLKEDRLFCNLNGDALAELDRIRYAASYPPNSVLFMEGQSPNSVMIICQGKVKLSVSSAEGKTIILNIAEPGEVLGLSSAISGRVHEATAETVEPVQVNIIRRDDFLRFLAKYRDVSMHAAQELSNVHNTACREIRILGLAQSVPEKLANLILSWDAKSSAQKRGSMKMTLTHEEIAQFLGTSRETVTRALNDFKKRKIIDIKGATLRITDPARLQAVAHSAR